MPPQWRIELFGRLRGLYQQQSITRFRTQKTGALLAYLAFYRERAHPRDTLIELLWPEAELESGQHNLRLALSSLRRQFEPPGIPAGAVLQATRATVQLNPETITTDVAEFEHILKRAAQTTNRTDKSALLAQMVALYQGPLLPGYYESWVLPQQLRLEDEYAQAVLDLLRLVEEAGDLAQAIRYGGQAVAADPTREELHLALMRLYARAGQPAQALQQYDRLERLLQEQWGEAPSAPARQLARALRERLAGSASPELPVAPPEPPAPPRTTSDLPSGTVTFLLAGIVTSQAPMEQAGQAVQAVLLDPRALLGPIFAQYSGHVLKEGNEAFWVAFPRVDTALACAIAAQQAMDAVPVRMALHTGDVALTPDGDHEAVLQHAVRILAAAHGGQILCSEATAALLRRALPPDRRLVNLGLYRLLDEPGAERLFQVEYPEMRERTFPPINAPTAYTGSLPPQATRFFGREAELARLQQGILSGETHLLTLTGPGGTGKTRLALEAAARLAEELRGAVWFVPLAGLAEAGLILPAIQEALGLIKQPEGEPLEQVAEMLARQPSLLVLDNFEHLVEEGASLVRQLLERAPALTCWITSRQRLALAGERELRLAPLPTPEALDTPEQLMQVESVQLFVDRAQAVRPDFQVTRSNARAVAELCQHLEGIPLALELAAARSHAISPAQMLGQLANRLDFFVSRQRETAARHRTLRAAIDWSYQLLASELRRFFACLSVFRGRWRVEAAEAVCEEPLALDSLEQLIEASLVQTEESAGEIRFHMLETLREFAHQALAPEEQAALAQRHYAYFLRQAEEIESALSGPDQAVWLDRLEKDHDNLRAALQRAGDAEQRLRLSGALWRFWYMRGYLQEGSGWLEESLKQASTAPTAERAKALTGAGILARSQGDFEAARRRLEESLAIQRTLKEQRSIALALKDLGSLAQECSDYTTARKYLEEGLALQREIGDTQGLAPTLGTLGNIAREQGDYVQAHALYTETLALFQSLQNTGGVAAALHSLGLVSQALGDYASAAELMEQSLTIRRSLGDTQNIARALHNLGNIAAYQSDYARAQRYHEEALELRRALGDKSGLAFSLLNLGNLAVHKGDFEAAPTYLQESLRLLQELQDKQGMAFALEALLGLVAAQLLTGSEKNRANAAAQAERAAHLSGAVEALREAIQAPRPLNDQQQYHRTLEEIAPILGEEAFQTAQNEGRAMSLEQALAYAIEKDEG